MGSGGARSRPLAGGRHLRGIAGAWKPSVFRCARRRHMKETLTQDVIKTSEIEGEKLDLQQVRSSIARRLGLDIGGTTASSPRNVEGIVEIMIAPRAITTGR